MHVVFILKYQEGGNWPQSHKMMHMRQSKTRAIIGIGATRLGAGIPNIGCVFRHPPPLATPVRALSRSYNSTRARNRMPFVCALPASPPLFLPIRTLIEREPQFMPMLCAALYSCAL
jgi:hypothetical protein